jgi:hypothetical protein
MQIVQIIVGAALLGFGRKGLALFLGALGLMLGVVLVTMYVHPASSGLLVAAMAAGGGVGLVVGLFIQKVAVGLAGILGGGYAGYAFAFSMGWIHGQFPWIAVAVGALLGLILAIFILKWALIILSSVAGSYLLVDAFGLTTSTATAVFVVLAIAGIVFQASSDKPKRTAQ